MFNFIGFFGIVISTFVSIWASFKYLLLGRYRIEDVVAKNLIDKINKELPMRWIIDTEHATPPRYPAIWEGIVVLNRIPIYFSRNERLLTAGWKSIDNTSTVTFFRWHRKSVDELLASQGTTTSVTVSALSPGSPDRLGEIETGSPGEIYLNEGSYEDIETDVKRTLDGELTKTSALLYGPPGNGKSRFVKYLAKKYSLPIFVVYFRDDYCNQDISIMFSNIPKRCIVLFEDFDSLFDGRQCIMTNEHIKFTFDAILNGLDGVHNDYKQVVFVMTVNDIHKVDDSLKNRPSRFKHVKEFSAPNRDVRMRILNDSKLVEETEGKSLDQVFFSADRQGRFDVKSDGVVE
jgi:hypothetical protein